MGEVAGMEGKNAFSSKQRSFIEGRVQAIPTFAISCFHLPIGLCQDIEMLIRKFWWGQRGDRRKIHWKKVGGVVPTKNGGWFRFQRSL